MHAIWGLGMLSPSKSVVVVDEHVDVHDYERRLLPRRRPTSIQARRPLTEGPLDHLDHAPARQFYGGKIGIDATHKCPRRTRGRGRRRSR